MKHALRVALPEGYAAGNIHAAAIKRLLLGWLLVSLLVGGGAYWFGLHQISQQVIALAKSESARVAPGILARVNGTAETIAVLQSMAQDYLQQGFVVVELYNRQGRMVVQATSEAAKTIEQALNERGSHPLPRGKRVQTSRLRLGKAEVIRVLYPLLDGGSLEGHFEGIFVVPDDKLEEINQQIQQLLATVFLVVLTTTLLLYPFIVSLNRKVQAEAQTIVRGNLELMAVLGSAIAKRDSDTNSHNHRVTLYAVGLAEKVGLHGQHIRELIAGALLHDVGKIGIHDAILLKPGKLSDEEYAAMQQHVELGLDIIRHSAWLHLAEDVVGSHHEWFDGNGYPKGLAGEAIALTARVFAIADVFDALTSRRPYKDRLPLEQTLDLMRRQSGSHFDPRLLEAFLDIAPELHTYFDRASDNALEQDLRAVVTHYWNSRRGMSSQLWREGLDMKMTKATAARWPRSS
jgi:HD-GYP domain-containing protein (c-di-GMP phosphodiesterase class II)